MTDHPQTSHSLVSESRSPGRVIRNGVAVMSVGVLSVLHSANAHATTSTAVADCNACASVSDLQSAATSYFNNGGTGIPAGTIVFMISLNQPISMYFYKDCPNGLMYPCTAVISPQYYGTPTQENANAATLDNMSHSRAAKLAPVVTAPNIQYNEVDEVIIQYIQTQIQATGPSGIDWWHLLQGFPQVAWYEMHDNQTGQTQRIFVGDTITVNYPNGYSEKWQFLGVHAGSVQWQRVPNTLMHNGQPVNPPSTSSASPVPGGGSVQGSNLYNSPGFINAVANGWICYGISTLGVQMADGTWLSSSGTFTYPCAG